LFVADEDLLRGKPRGRKDLFVVLQKFYKTRASREKEGHNCLLTCIAPCYTYFTKG
jgi:hypothetical protein